MGQKRFDTRRVIEVTATVAILSLTIAAVVIVAQWRREAARPPATETKGAEVIDPLDIDIGASPVNGPASAKLGLVMFMDVECPFCDRWVKRVLPGIRGRFVDSGEVQLIYKHFPLDELHPDARRVHVLTACATPVAEFWRLQATMPISVLPTVTAESMIRDSSLDRRLFLNCVKNEGSAIVEADIRQGQNVGVTATPTIFLGALDKGVVRASRRIAGFWPTAVYEEALSDLLQQAR